MDRVRINEKTLTNNQKGMNIRILRENLADGINVGLVVFNPVVRNRILAVTGERGAVAVREVVNHKLTRDRGVRSGRILRFYVGQIVRHGRNFVGGIPGMC